MSRLSLKLWCYRMLRMMILCCLTADPGPAKGNAIEDDLLQDRNFRRQCAIHLASASLSTEAVPWLEYVLMDHTLVTGDKVYPLAQVLNTLDLDDSTISGLRHRRVLTVGEGFSALLPFLVSRGVDIQAVDLWYHSKDYPDNEVGRLMREYNRQHTTRLVRGSALNLPFEDGCFEMLLTHQMLGGFPLWMQTLFIDEIYRVLASRGRARLAVVSCSNSLDIGTYIYRNYGGRMNYLCRPVQAKATLLSGHESVQEGALMILEKDGV